MAQWDAAGLWSPPSLQRHVVEGRGRAPFRAADGQRPCGTHTHPVLTATAPAGLELTPCRCSAPNSPQYFKKTKISALALLKMVGRGGGRRCRAGVGGVMARPDTVDHWSDDHHPFSPKVMHARSGGRLEVMGLMQGKIDGDTMVVMDAFALPVEGWLGVPGWCAALSPIVHPPLPPLSQGTETRVSAQEQAYGYMIGYQELIKKV